MVFEAPNATIKTFTAERVRLYIQQCLRDYPALSANAKLTDMLDAHIHQMVLKLTTWCMAGRIPTRFEDEVVEWPDGVWQTFKQKFMPHWFTKKFPVRMSQRLIQKNMHVYFVCPHLVTDPHHMHVKFMATGANTPDWMNEVRR